MNKNRNYIYEYIDKYLAIIYTLQYLNIHNDFFLIIFWYLIILEIIFVFWKCIKYNRTEIIISELCTRDPMLIN